MLIFLFTISLVVLTFLVLYGLLQSKVRSETEVQSRIKKIDAITAMPRKGREKTEAEKAALRGRSLEEMTFSERVIQPLMEKFGQFLGQFAPAGMAKSLEHRIVLAGKQREWSVGQLFAAIFFGAAAMCVLSWLYLQAADFSAVQKVAIVLLGTFIGGYAPISVTKIMATKRQQAIQSQLPEMLDLLCVSVQAGLSFDSSLRKIIGRMHGPLIDECRHFQEDVRMGMVRRTALKNLAQRCEVQEVSLFVAALVQSERLGTSMANTLKSQADNMRDRRRQHVKAEAMKAPVKIIFPLVFFIFPSLFIVTLVPSALSLMKNLGH